MMKISEQKMQELLEGNTESIRLEFKESVNLNELCWLRDKVICAIFAMSNTKSGGTIVIGVKDINGGNADFSEGLLDAHQAPNLDDFKNVVERFASAPVSYEVGIGPYMSKNFLVISVKEFTEYPVICRENSNIPKADVSNTENKKRPLEAGAIYIRTLKDKPSSVKLTNPVDIHDLLNRTVDRQVGNLHKRGWKHISEEVPRDEELYRKERGTV